MPKGITKQWTDKQIAYLVVRYTQGKSFASILKGLAKKFPNEGFEKMHINTVISQWTKLNKDTAHNFTQSEVDFGTSRN